MKTLVGCFMNGLTISAMYILVASGFALMLNIMGIFNFAHGAIYALGGYITFAFSTGLGVNRYLALALSVVISVLLGIGLERFCWRPFVGNTNGVIIMAVALIFIIETALTVTYGGVLRSVEPFVPGNVVVGFFSTSWARIFALAVGVVLLLGLTVFIRKTRVGKQMSAVSQDKVGALLQGININRTSAVATAIACGAAALAGSLMASILSLSPYMGDNPLTKAIEVVILSGFGSIGGVFLGGVILGFLDAILPVFLDTGPAESISMLVVIAILLVRPKGLFGYEVL
jgi:branched-chain amino acid transport system permease protein